MIAIEYAPAKNLAFSAAIRRRELSRFLSDAAAAVGLSGKVCVLLAGDDRLRALNREFRGFDKPTDVLSFPVPPNEFPNGDAGDLAISVETASRQAAQFGHSLQTEIKVLILHGLLHLSGEDHETDSGRMLRREKRLRKDLGLPVSLIERTQPRRRRSESSAPRPAARKISRGERPGRRSQ